MIQLSVPDLSEFLGLYGLKSGWESSLFSTFTVTNKNEAQSQCNSDERYFFRSISDVYFGLKPQAKVFVELYPSFLLSVLVLV